MDKEKCLVSCNPTLMRGLTSATAVAVSPLKFRLRMDYHGLDSSVSLWNNLKAWVRNHPWYSSCLAVLCGINAVPIVSFAAAYITIKFTMRVGSSLFQGAKRLLGFQTTKSTKFDDEYHLSHVNRQMAEYWGRFRIVPSTRRDKKVVSLYNDVADFKMLEECTRMLQTTDTAEVYTYLTCDDGDVDSAIADVETESGVSDQYAADHPDIIRGLDAKQSESAVTDATQESETGEAAVSLSASKSSINDSTTSSEHRLSRDGLNKVKRKKKKRLSWLFQKKKLSP